MAKLKAVGQEHKAPEVSLLRYRDRETATRLWPDNHYNRERWLAAIVYLRRTVGWKCDLGA